MRGPGPNFPPWGRPVVSLEVDAMPCFITVRFRLLAALAALLAGAACNAEKNTTVYQDAHVGTGGFEGTPLSLTALSSDGLAFTESGLDFSDVRRFDSGRGEAVFLCVVRKPGAGDELLFASYDDGKAFTPPVELRGRNQDPSEPVDLSRAFVAFLYPGNERDGDAVIGFLRQDLDDAGSSATIDPNVRLYTAYFDRSGRAVESKSGDVSIRYGFETDCPALDLTDDDYTGADVALAGFLSGGSIGPLSFPDAVPYTNPRQGDETPYLLFFWAQAASDGAPVRMHCASFDLTDANAGDQFGPPAEVALDPGAGASDEVDTAGARVVENALFFRKTDGVDTTLLVALHDETAGALLASAHALSPSTGDPDTALLPAPGALFGPETGLTRVLGVFECTGGTMGENSLYAFQVDPTDAASAFSETTDRVELDAGTGTTSLFDVLPGSAEDAVVMNRTGEWVLVVWIQNQAEDTAVPALWVNVIQTPRTDTPPDLGDAVTGAYRVDQAPGSGPPVEEDFTVQRELGFGGVQSDRNVVNLAWQQDETGSVDTLRFNSITVTLGSPPSAVRGSEGSVDFNDTGLVMKEVHLMDGGGSGGTPGAPLLYYIRDARSSAPASRRLYQYRSGAGEMEIGSLAGTTAGTWHPRQAWDGLRVITTPRNADVTGRPDDAGRYHHVFVREYRYLDRGELALRHRRFDKHSTAAWGERFLPPADGATAPAEIDTGVDLTATRLGDAVDGDRVGVFFHQGEHIWYNEFDPGRAAWRSDPALVDDVFPEAVQLRGLLLPFLKDDPDDLEGTAVYWTKDFSTGTPVHRMFLRLKY